MPENPQWPKFYGFGEAHKTKDDGFVLQKILRTNAKELRKTYRNQEVIFVSGAQVAKTPETFEFVMFTRHQQPKAGP